VESVQASRKWDLVQAITGRTGWVKSQFLAYSLFRDLLVVYIMSEVVYATAPLQEETRQMKSRALTDRDKVRCWSF
jgi:hypothetical protein